MRLRNYLLGALGLLGVLIAFAPDPVAPQIIGSGIMGSEKAGSAPATCADNSYGWSGAQADTSFTVPANCTLMAGFVWGQGGTGTTGTVGQGGNGGGSGAMEQAGNPGMIPNAISVTPGSTLHICITASSTIVSTVAGCATGQLILANGASGNTAGSTTGAVCTAGACVATAGANGGVSATGSYGGAGGAGAPGTRVTVRAGGITTAADYGGGGGGGSSGLATTTPAAATTSGRAGGAGGSGTGGGTGGGSSGSHPGHDATAGSGGGGQGGYGSNGNTSGAGGAGATFNDLLLTTSSASGTVSSGSYINGGGGGGGSGGAGSGYAVAIGGAGGGCGGGGGGSGGNITSGGTNAGGGAGGPGCVYLAFTDTNVPTNYDIGDLYVPGNVEFYIGGDCYRKLGTYNIASVWDTTTSADVATVQCVNGVISTTGGSTWTWATVQANCLTTQCLIHLLYDQSASGRCTGVACTFTGNGGVTPTTSANPYFVYANGSTCNGQAAGGFCIEAPAATQYAYAQLGTPTQAQPINVACVMSDATGTRDVLAAASPNYLTWGLGGTGFQGFHYAGTTYVSTSNSTSANHLAALFSSVNGASSYLQLNNGTVVTTTPGATGYGASEYLFVPGQTIMSTVQACFSTTDVVWDATSAGNMYGVWKAHFGGGMP